MQMHDYAGAGLNSVGPAMGPKLSPVEGSNIYNQPEFGKSLFIFYMC